MDRDGLRARRDHEWQQAVVHALCDAPVLHDRNARAMLAELIGDELGRPVVLREQPTPHLQMLELVRFCVRAGHTGPIALSHAVSLLEGPGPTAETVGRLVRELVRTAAPAPAACLPARFLVSYVAADRPWADWVVRQLEDAGLRARHVRRRTGGGRHGGPPEADERLIALLSPAYLAAVHGLAPPWWAVLRDDPRGLADGIVPVVVTPCRPEGPLSSMSCVDLTGLGEDEARSRLLHAVGAAPTGRTAPAAPQPPFPDPAGRR
ncbi:toll/interleukin-1 receptor domain-containing protein [Streptomyces cadmiisoli]|uniref:toll/interleukin-1 receptor domain-containing protein n=1 Tax=Streptomyces cadmiisoli TaxID=2184053 RepID=UPI00364FF2FE